MSKALEYNMLSPTGKCKSFDSAADGYCRSEAIGIVIRKSKRRWLFICNVTGTNSDGFTSKGITYPVIDSQIF